MKISQYKASGSPPVDLFAFVPTTILIGWELSDSVCSTPLRWSPDFNLYLAAGLPPGSKVSHVAVVDLRAGKFTDITAARQKSGFGDPVLSEDNPMFLSDTPTDKVTFGSNVIRVTQAGSPGTGTVLVDRRTPEKQTVVPESTGPATLTAGDSATHLNSLDNQTYRTVSPGGDYIADGTGLRSTAHPDQTIGFSCDPNAGVIPEFLGWVDANSFAISTSRLAFLVTAGPTPTCVPMLPATDRTIGFFSLSDDDGKLYFRAVNTTGGETEYSIPANKPGSEPQPDTYPVGQLHTVYARGNY